ncbi:ORF6N domain-containing protein [Metaclostridioides mangenotii]|uniref:ORF6N domain-containing protein n=1 Tax=Metaclostridioides mangenotii TaxID=1540 RepID=UPI0026EEF21A|nr:ORF6N domain-containing protein [Clostridioides mangenotii]
MNNLIPIKFKKQNVITTELLAEVYGTDTKNISNNFNNNKDKFEEGKHYYFLEGEELKEFKGNHMKYDNLKFAPKLYLWTERGANRHCKILDTDKAWEQFDNLEETYFKVKENVSLNTQGLSPQLQALISIELKQKQMEKDIADTKQDIKGIKDVVALSSINWRPDSTRLINAMASKLGDYGHIEALRNESYEQLEQRMACKLGVRLTYKRQRLADNGVCKSKRDKLNNLDVIADDKHLIEGYVAIVKEMAIKYGVANTLN